MSLALLILLSCQQSKQKDIEWKYYGNQGNTRYSEADQIGPANVSRLTRAWTFSTGDPDEKNQLQLQCHPIMVNGKLYVTSGRGKVFALDASSGKLIWTFDALHDPTASETNRGVVYWESQDKNDRRIFFSARSNLYALNAETGLPVNGFGDSGYIDLKKGLDRDISAQFVIATTPGVIYKDLLIMGSRVHEGPGSSAPGHIRAFNVRNGKREWIFHTIPHPGEFGYDTWPADAWKRSGGVNAWSGMTIDPERGLLFAPLGSASYDFYGADRKGNNLFGNSLVALDAATGKRKWHFQTIHHDLWDRDLPAPPTLITVHKDGKAIDAVAQVTKTGFVFVFNRDTGEPIFPIEEKQVPTDALPGETPSPTQPYPLRPEPFVRQAFTDSDISRLTPETYAYVKSRLSSIKRNHMFQPPSEQGTLILPGFDGGGEWGGAAYDKRSGTLYVNGNEMAWILSMIPKAQSGQNTHGRTIYLNNCSGCHGVDLEGASTQYPALKDLGSRLDSTAIALIMINGKGRMPSFNQIPDFQKKDLIKYLLQKEKKNDPSDHRAMQTGGADDMPNFIGTGYHRFLDLQGYPAIAPPWGTLNAIDLNEGKIRWRVPLGAFKELTQKGVPPTGTENYGGPIVTSTGILFIGATRDEMFRAFDINNGKVLWETNLPAGGYATPTTYMINEKQFVVIAAGGGKMGTPSGNNYIAYSLPDEK
jgi:quinoprotein glucose dehydrogenase